MSSYIISGGSDKFDTSECENLANMIRIYYKDISFKIVLKDPSEWEQYIDEICRIYGFKTKSNPIIYTTDGKLIGDRQAFVNLAEARFGISNPKLRQGPVTPDINKKAAKTELDAKIKNQKNLKTLTEKIEISTLNILTKGDVKPTDGYFEHKFSTGINFYVKFEEHLCPPYILQTEFSKDEKRIEIEEEDLVLAEVVGEDGKKSIKKIQMFAERFVTIEHKHSLLQQQAQQDLVLNLNDLKNTNSVKGTSLHDALQTLQPQKSEALISFDNNEDIAPNTEVQVKSEQENNEEDENENVSQQIQEDEIRPESAPMQFEQKEGIPKLIKINNLIIHKFKNEMILMLHPSPLIEGHYILFEPLLKAGLLPEDPEDIFIQDFSQIIRGRYNSYKALIKSQDVFKVEGLYNNQLDIYKSLNLQTCESIVELISKVDVVVSINILPQEIASFLPLSNGHVNVLVRKFGLLQMQNIHILKYLSDPLETNIGQSKQLFPLEEYILDQKSKCFILNVNVYQMKELDFTHYIAFPEKMLTAEQTQLNIIQLFAAFLEQNLNAPLKMGYTLIISRYIIFFAPSFIDNKTINGVNIHLPAFAYLGFLNLPKNQNSSKNIEHDYFNLINETQKQIKSIEL